MQVRLDVAVPLRETWFGVSEHTRPRRDDVDDSIRLPVNPSRLVNVTIAVPVDLALNLKEFAPTAI